jgi:hypothetical protein
MCANRTRSIGAHEIGCHTHYVGHGLHMCANRTSSIGAHDGDSNGGLIERKRCYIAVGERYGAPIELILLAHHIVMK